VLVAAEGPGEGTHEDLGTWRRAAAAAAAAAVAQLPHESARAGKRVSRKRAGLLCVVC